MEAHEHLVGAVAIPAFDALGIHVGGHGVVNVQQRHGLAGDASADVLGQRAVDVHLAGHRDAAGGQAAVDVAGHEAELGLERRPALVGHDHVLGGALVVLDPVEQGQFILCQAGQNTGHLVAFAQFGFHLGDLRGDAGIVCMLLVGLQQIQLGVLLNVDAQLEQGGDGGVAGEEVEGTGAEGDDLQVAQAQQGAGDGRELLDHVGALLGGADGVFRNVSLDAAELQVVRCVQHAAECVAAVAGQNADVLLSGSDVHGGAVEQFCNGGLRTLRAEIAEEHGQRVDARLLQVLVGFHDVCVNAAFDDDRALVDVVATVLQSCNDCLAAGFGQSDREAVAADCNNAHLDLRNVVHRNYLQSIL